MKIVYDHQIFSSQKWGGISRYHCELMANMADEEWELPLYFSNNQYVQELKKVRAFFPNSEFRGKNRILERINRLATLKTLKKGEFDIFHPTFYEPYFLEQLGNKPLVVTVHDLIHDLYPQLPAHQWEVAAKRAVVERANAIITPSQATADDLLKILGTPAKKIYVIPHGVTTQRVTAKESSESEFIFVGNRAYYKNFDVVLRALTIAKEFKLLCIGNNLSSEELARITELNLTKRVRVEQVASDELLLERYAQSLGFIFPSEYEGFGLPVLEAFCSSCPAILSDIKVFREVAEDAALYFPANDEQALALAMRELANNRNYWQAQAQARVELFSWQKCAQNTVEIYSKL